MVIKVWTFPNTTPIQLKRQAKIVVVTLNTNKFFIHISLFILIVLRTIKLK